MSILSNNQKSLLNLLCKDKNIVKHFYLTGGTALAEYYLSHRLSEDLDFFAENEFEPQDISFVLKKIQDKVGITNIKYQQSFNRNLFFLELKDDTIKTEFTYFPFTRIEIKNKVGDLYIESLIDIAVNKIFTIYQKPRSRDFIDLYFILQKEKSWTIAELIKKTQVKFDHYIDPIQLGAQFTKVNELKDYPNMIINIPEKEWQDFFMNEIKKLSHEILE